MDTRDPFMFSRRDLLRWGGTLLGAGAAGLRLGLPQRVHAQDQFLLPANYTCAQTGIIEVHPTSPLILDPFSEELPIPLPMQPSSLADMMQSINIAPGPGIGQQDSDPKSKHQIWTSDLGLPDPIFYRIKLQVSGHLFTNSNVQPIDQFGNFIIAPNGTGVQKLPYSCIYGFNGTFPGPMIYAKYGQPCLVRFENHLDFNPDGWDRCDFGADNYTFLTHLHNGHTAPESDGNPHHKPGAYNPGEFVDNLYLNYPAGNDDAEKQSFFWFHDHKMDFTGADVYKGMVGLFPIYDPLRDYGNENDTKNKNNLRLPGVPNPITGRIDYDVPLALYDCAFDDGVTQHKDWHNGCGEAHPEWWGNTFFRHFPNHGFVGDVFTVNGQACPVWHVKRRKYRLRFLDASIARCYRLQLMSSKKGPLDARNIYDVNLENVIGQETNPARRQGQWRIRDGEQCMRFTEIATDGGLLPYPIMRDSFELWPAKRREVIVDFSRYQDGTPTTSGVDVIWLVNTLQMTTGRKPNAPQMVEDNTGRLIDDADFDPTFCVPLIKIVIGDLAPDNSQVPNTLRPLATINTKKLSQLPARTFTLVRGGFGGELEWAIAEGAKPPLPFDPLNALAKPNRGVPELWTIRNGGGGWVHPLHLHYEEHRVISRNGVPTPLDPRHPDDNSREDVIALDPGEEVVIYRNFRTFVGKYVSHCHNLAHEDHAMMFGWTVQP